MSNWRPAGRRLFSGPRKHFVAQCECLASEFGLRKIVPKKKEKKSFKLKLRENSDHCRSENIYFQKKFRQLLSEKCEKIPIESVNFQKRNIYRNVFQTVCRGRFAGVPKVLKYFILPKLRKCCHDLIVDNCYKSPMALWLRPFFLKISTISGYITQFLEMVARRSGDFQIMPLVINRYTFAWLVCREI